MQKSIDLGRGKYWSNGLLHMQNKVSKILFVVYITRSLIEVNILDPKKVCLKKQTESSALRTGNVKHNEQQLR